MSYSVSFSVIKDELLRVLKQLKKVEKSVHKKNTTLEVTIVNGFIQLVIPGVHLQIKTLNNGTAKFTIGLAYFTDVVNSEKDKDLNFILAENQLKLRGFSFSVRTTFFETDTILRSIDLPVNYTLMDISKMYLTGKYTIDEILFNNLDKQVVDAINTVKADVAKIALLMKKYGFPWKKLKIFY